MDLVRAAQLAHEDSKRWFPNVSQNLLFNLGCMMAEAGEAYNQEKKVVRGSHSAEEVRDKVIEEVVDTFTYMLNICGMLGVDLEAEYWKKQMINEARFNPRHISLTDGHKLA